MNGLFPPNFSLNVLESVSLSWTSYLCCKMVIFPVLTFLLHLLAVHVLERFSYPSSLLPFPLLLIILNWIFIY